MRPRRRPRKSATGAPSKAPKNYELVSLVSVSTYTGCTYFACGKQGDDLGLLARRDACLHGLRVDVAGVELFEPVRHRQDTANGSGVISEQNTSKCNEEANQNGWPRLARRPWWWSKSERHGCGYHSDGKGVEISIDADGQQVQQHQIKSQSRRKRVEHEMSEHNLQTYRGKGESLCVSPCRCTSHRQHATRCYHTMAVPQTNRVESPWSSSLARSSKRR